MSGNGANDRIRLRLHYGGHFTTVQHADGGPSFKYSGGEVFNDSITQPCQYSDVCRKLNDKFGDTVSFRYQQPGEDLDPDTLVMVTDNDDLQELFEEYAQALTRPNTPQKTFRIKVFVFPALQFETEYGGSPTRAARAVGMTPFTPCEENFMDVSMAAAEGPHFESWCTEGEGEASEESQPSAHPSSDTEVQLAHSGLHHANGAYGAPAWFGAAPGWVLPPAGVDQRSMHPQPVGRRSSNSSAAAAAAGPGPLGGGASLLTPWVDVNRPPAGIMQGGGNGVAVGMALSRAARTSHSGGMPNGGSANGRGGNGGGGFQLFGNGSGSAFNGDGSSGHGGGAACGAWDAAGGGGAADAHAGNGAAEAWVYGQHRNELTGLGNDGSGYYDDAGGAAWNGADAAGFADAGYGDAGGGGTAAGGGGGGAGGEDWAVAQGYSAAPGGAFGLAAVDPSAMGVGGAGPDRSAPLPLAWQHLPAATLDNLAFINISRSVDRHGFVSGGGGNGGGGVSAFGGGNGNAGGGRDEYTEDDFDVPDDPYEEQAQDSSLSSGRQGPGGNGGSAAGVVKAGANGVARSSLHLPDTLDIGGGGGGGGATAGLPLHMRDNVLSALPSHISAFGDSVGGGGGGRDGSLQLPSHISAFGDSNAEMPEGMMMSPPSGLADLGGVNRGGGGVGAGSSKVCITQEFSPKWDASLERTPGGAPPARPDFGRPTADGGARSASTTPKHLLAQVVTVRRADVTILRKIGEGAFGEVSQATVFPYGTVAIKWLKKERFAKYSESFQQEAEVLSQLNHPNIIRMYGLVTEPDPAGGKDDQIAGIMTEFVRGGSLSQQLRSLQRRLTLRERALVARQAVLGMAYLHDQSPAIIHFDLKPDNLLVDGQGDSLTVKVADFGLSKHKFNSYVSCRDLRGTLPYMAPELVSNPNQVCEKCDVWSMGVVLWEMVALAVPFQDLSAQQILVGLMHGSLHLAVPQDCEPAWRDLIELCVETHPACRPTFRQLAAQLEAILQQQDADSGVTQPAY